MIEVARIQQLGVTSVEEQPGDDGQYDAGWVDKWMASAVTLTTGL